MSVNIDLTFFFARGAHSFYCIFSAWDLSSISVLCEYCLYSSNVHSKIFISSITSVCVYFTTSFSRYLTVYFLQFLVCFFFAVFIQFIGFLYFFVCVFLAVFEVFFFLFPPIVGIFLGFFEWFSCFLIKDLLQLHIVGFKAFVL